MKRRALLLNPGYYEVGDYGISHMPNMGLLKIARYLKNKGVEVIYQDFSIPSRLSGTNMNLKEHDRKAPFSKFIRCGNFQKEGIVKAQRYFGWPHRLIRENIKAANPTEIWLGTCLTYYWETVKEIAEICKEEFPKVPLFLGGIYPTLYPQHAAVNIPHDYLHQGPFEDIDDLFPDYSVDTSPKSIRTIQLGKGCNVFPPCSFCSVVAMDPKFKVISSDATFEYIKEEYSKGATYWRIWSSQLLVPPERFKKLLKLIIDSDIKIQLVASEGVQPSLFNQEISDLMQRAGFGVVSIPMESINEEVNADFRKPSTFNDYENAVACAQRSGFKHIKSFVMIGVPGQSYDDMTRAIVDCWARDVIPALHQYTPIPGSYDWERFTQFHSVSPEELHPSLWPGASAEMKVSHLEEIKKIAKVGPYKFAELYGRSDLPKGYVEAREIWYLYYKWCKIYGLIGSDGAATYKRPLAYPSYSSAWTDYVSSGKNKVQPSSELICQ